MPRMPKKLSGVIFDVDGTLLDSMPIWNNLGVIYLRSVGIEPREGLREVLWTMTIPEAAHFLQRTYEIDAPLEKVEGDIRGIIEEFYSQKAPAKVGVPEFLEALERKGIGMCVATATDRPLIESALARLGLREYFSKIFTCREVGANKTKRRIYDLAWHHLGTKKSETLIFEDAYYAIQTAKHAGYRVAAVHDASEEQHHPIRSLADYYFEDLTPQSVSSVLAL